MSLPFGRAVQRKRTGDDVIVARGRKHALPIAALGVEADKLVNKNQWTFDDFTKAAQTQLDAINAKKPQSPEKVLPSNRTLKRSFSQLCPHEANESDQQTLGRYIAACDLMGQASVVASLGVFYRGKPKDLIVNLDASTLKISEGRPPEAKAKVRASRNAYKHTRGRGVGMGITGNQKFKFRTAKFLPLISQAGNLVDATYVIKAQPGDTVPTLKVYSVKGLGNRGPSHPGHIIVVPETHSAAVRVGKLPAAFRSWMAGTGPTGPG